jgi:hypothetical protein
MTEKVKREIGGLHPKLLIMGHGRCGKDTAALYMMQKHGYRWNGSFSWHMLPHMAELLHLPQQIAWDTRHKHREIWRDEINEYRRGDPSRLMRAVFAKADIGSGPRPRVEFEAAKREAIFDYAIFIDKDVPVDPTFEMTRDDADYVIDNNMSFEHLYAQLDHVSQILALTHAKKDRFTS